MSKKKKQKHINSISCGQGAPSLYLILMAAAGVFKAETVIVADTGWENDMLWSNGKRTNAQEFFLTVTKPLAEAHGMSAHFVRTLDNRKNPLPDLQTTQFPGTADIPLFGSRGGQLNQSCTSKWKVQGIRQQLRRMGATTATCNLGLTITELQRVKPNNDVAWETLAWPMIFTLKTHRATAIQKLEDAGVEYLVTSECDGCPHKDPERWLRTSPEQIAELAKFESRFDNNFFLTSDRIPLMDAIQLMRDGRSMSAFDPCENGYCFT